MTTKEEFVDVLKYGKCPKCDKNIALLPHTCPFSQDVYDDSDTKCVCCDDCIQECAYDI